MFVRRPRHSQIQNWHVNEHCMQPCSLSGALCNGSRERPLAELWDKFKWSDWALFPALSPSSAPLQVGLLSQLQMTHAVPERQSFPTQRESSLQVAEYLKKITKKGWEGHKNLHLRMLNSTCWNCSSPPSCKMFCIWRIGFLCVSCH